MARKSTKRPDAAARVTKRVKRPVQSSGAWSSSQQTRAPLAGGSQSPPLAEMTEAEFSIRLQDGIQAWHERAPTSETAAAFHPIPVDVSGRISLVLSLKKAHQDIPIMPARRFEAGVVFAIANWTGARPVAVLQTLIQLATKMLPAALMSRLGGLLVTSALDGEKPRDRDRTINLLVTLATDYAFDREIENFFALLTANGLWKPGMATRLVRARAAVDQPGWLDHAKRHMADWKALAQRAELYDVKHMLHNVVSTAGLPAVAQAIMTMKFDEDEKWIVEQLGGRHAPVLRRVERGDGVYLVLDDKGMLLPKRERSKNTLEGWNIYLSDEELIEHYFPIVNEVDEEDGRKLINLEEFRAKKRPVGGPAPEISPSVSTEQNPEASRD
jgi:hypothetical protein